MLYGGIFLALFSMFTFGYAAGQAHLTADLKEIQDECSKWLEECRRLQEETKVNLERRLDNILFGDNK